MESILFCFFFCFDLCYLYMPWCTLYASPNWPSLSAGLLSACISHLITSNLVVSAGLQQLDYRHASAQLDTPMIIPGILKLPPDWSRIFARIEPESEIFCTHAYSSALLCFIFVFFFLAFIHSFTCSSFIHSLMRICLCGECSLSLHCLSFQWPGRHNRINHQLIPSCRRLNNQSVSQPKQTTPTPMII